LEQTSTEIRTTVSLTYGITELTTIKIFNNSHLS